MLFADLLFMYVFLPLCIGSYFIARGIKAKNIVLVVFSLIFYAWGEPVRILLLIAGTLVNYFLARLMDTKFPQKTRKLAIVLSLIFNIGMLGVFKYTDFIIENINLIPGVEIPKTGITLMLGISFYTFQIISYMVDVYWEKVPVQKNYGKLLLYISLFPQLVSGPIVRYQTIADEINDRHTSVNDAIEGFARVIVGLSKKILLANNLYLLVQQCFMETEGGVFANATVGGTWIGIIAYSMQVYFDFSGYSDMAIGMGRIFGFHFDENFKYPFMTRSISEYWQRWHISLGSFFRDYLLYVPIFGKRRATLSLFLVWFTTGIWHGASWNYIVWGLYFGVFVFLETKIGKKNLKKVPDVVMHIYNKLVIVLGFAIFRFKNFADIGTFFKNIVGANGNALWNSDTSEALMSYLFIFIVSLIACFPFTQIIKDKLKNSKQSVQTAATVCLTAFILLLLFTDTSVLVKTFSSNNPFLYGDF